jgi:hypothetical protein
MTDTKDKAHSSFGVAIEPEFNEEGKWTGAVHASLEENFENDLTDDELTQIRSVCGMMASTLTLMENDPDFLDYVRDYFVNNFSDMIEEFLEDLEDDEEKAPNFTQEGNVIKLNFNTKTFGSA